ncbi:hypothetical protein [Hamadaea tsunoensis]|uniref:hypothetical protein n=1 Tax=Hamadaea tsunoensis TaxID=53368 RepID=UPI0004290EB3|nr:hypothetical protein [Hamadaea tsunoensis]
MSDEEHLRAILLDAVPPLTGPQDWSTVVARRVRRTRRRVALAAAVSTVVAMIGSSMTVQLIGNTATPPHRPALTCPEVPADWLQTVPDSDTPGRFIDPSGVASVSMCLKTVSGPPREETVWTLDTRLPQMLDVFNAMPTKANFNEQRKRNHPDANIPSEWMCDAVGYFQEFAFAVTYTDGRVVTVLTDRNCGLAYLDGHLRVMQPSPVNTFKQLYLGQQISRTDPATVATPSCPSTTSGAGEFIDQISAMRIATLTSDDPFLPTPLVAVALCRYADNGTGLRLTAHYEARTTGDPRLPGPVDTWRQRINAATARREGAAGCHGASDLANATALDVMWAADESGAVSAVPVEWGPCRQVVARNATIPPSESLKEYLDQVLATR